MFEIEASAARLRVANATDGRDGRARCVGRGSISSGRSSSGRCQPLTIRAATAARIALPRLESTVEPTLYGRSIPAVPQRSPRASSARCLPLMLSNPSEIGPARTRGGRSAPARASAFFAPRTEPLGATPAGALPPQLDGLALILNPPPRGPSDRVRTAPPSTRRLLSALRPSGPTREAAVCSVSRVDTRVLRMAARLL